MKETIRKVICVALVLCVLSSNNVYAAKFNKTNALDYANKYWKNYNSKYRAFNPHGDGGDCANFVSQCMVAGGCPTSLTSWYCDKYTYRKNWTSCDHQLEYFKKKGWVELSATYVGTAKAPKSNSSIGTGTIVYYDWENDGDIDHVAITTLRDYKGYGYVTAHTKDRYNNIWNFEDHIADKYRKTVKYYIYRIKY